MSLGILNNIVMQIVSVGYITGTLQDSAETVLNSSTDAVFTAGVAEKA